MGKHCSKTKTMRENIVIIHSVLKKKIRSKIDEEHFRKKKKKKIHKKIKKPCREIL
jgi:hypothetical protein